MQAVQKVVQKHISSLLLLLLAGGFAILLAELLITQHTDGVQLVGVVAAVAGLLLLLAALFVRGRASMFLALLLLLLSVTGLIGTYEHLEEGGEEGERASIQQTETGGYQPIAFVQDDDGDDEEEASESRFSDARRPEEGEETPPPLAPLSLAGLSLMGAVVLVGVPRERSTTIGN